MPMTPEERNRRRREQYAAGRAAGLFRDQLRSARKTAEQDPYLMDVISNLFSGITKGFQDMVSDVAEAVTGFTPNDGSPPSSKGSARSGGSGSRGGASGGSSRSSGGGGTPSKRSGGSGGGGNKPPSKPKAPQKKKPSAAGDFKKFIKRELKKNPKTSSRELEKKYKEKTGGKIGHKGAQAAIREVKGQAEKTSTKITKFTETIGGKSYAGTLRKGIKYYGPERNPQQVKYIKKGYLYVVKYKVEREGFAEPETNYLTITSSRQLTEKDLIDNGMVESALGEGQSRGKKVDKYKLERVIPESVQIMYAIDNRTK